MMESRRKTWTWKRVESKKRKEEKERSEIKKTRRGEAKKIE